MSEPTRESAAQEQGSQQVEHVTIACLIDVIGEVDWVRGFQFRRMRAATPDDLRAELARLEKQE